MLFRSVSHVILERLSHQRHVAGDGRRLRRPGWHAFHSPPEERPITTLPVARNLLPPARRVGCLRRARWGSALAVALLPPAPIPVRQADHRAERHPLPEEAATTIPPNEAHLPELRGGGRSDHRPATGGPCVLLAHATLLRRSQDSPRALRGGCPARAGLRSQAKRDRLIFPEARGGSFLYRFARRVSRLGSPGPAAFLYSWPVSVSARMLSPVARISASLGRRGLFVRRRISGHQV